MIADPRHPGSANRATKLRHSVAQVRILPLASVCLTRPLSYPHDFPDAPRDREAAQGRVAALSMRHVA